MMPGMPALSFVAARMLLVAVSLMPLLISPAVSFAEQELGPVMRGHNKIGGPNQISEYIRRIFQDKKGHFWFATNSDGVVRYDGETLKYFGPAEGLAGHQVTRILQDRHGDMWFTTNGGVSRYDGKVFTNYGKEDGLHDVYAWSILEDSKGTIWVGTLGGAFRFDDKSFVPFPLPEASELDHNRGVSSRKIISSIFEDRAGNIWFGSGMAGAHRYDGKAVTTMTTKDGLCNDAVNSIIEDDQGHVWFATHHNGVCRYDGKSFTHFGKADGIAGYEAWSFYKDTSGHIWFPIEHAGVYRYDGKTFKNFGKEQGLESGAIQCVFQDRDGRYWFGGAGGLFFLKGDRFVNVTKHGPWP